MRLFILFIYLNILYLQGCVPDAPHKNPVDPYGQNQITSGKNIKGQILQKTSPHSPIENCRILLHPEQLFTRSDIKGQFTFQDIQSGLHELIMTKTGYQTDSLSFNSDTLNQDLFFYMNAKPIIDSIRIYSEYIDQWWPESTINIICELIAHDPDGTNDIADIKLTFPELDVSFELNRTSQIDSFGLQLSNNVLEIDVYELIGSPCISGITDLSGATVYSLPHYLIRIIDESPEPTAPTGLETVDKNPVFAWEPYGALYGFSYEIYIYLVNAGVPILVWSEKNLPSTRTFYQYPDTLQSGTYFWTIGVRDHLGNFSRSKEASFLIQ